MREVMITGISGQDGSYLAELLTQQGYSVVGTSRSPGRARQQLPDSIRASVELLPWDGHDPASFRDIRRFWMENMPVSSTASMWKALAAPYSTKCRQVLRNKRDASRET